MTTPRKCPRAGCPNVFVPRSPNQRYCDGVCQTRAAKAAYRERQRQKRAEAERELAGPRVFDLIRDAWRSRLQRFAAAKVWP